MTGIFKANNPLNNSVLFIYGLLLKLAFFSSATMPHVKVNDGILFKGLLAILKTPGLKFPIIYPCITYLLLFSQAVAFNKLINKQRLTHRSTHLTAMSYLLITSMFPEWNVLSSALVVNTFMIWIWGRINNLYNSLNPKTALFNIGIVMGICSFFYFPSILFLLLILFELMYTRAFSLPEWIITLIGVIAPFYFLFAALYLSGNLNYYDLTFTSINYPVFYKSYWSLIAIALLLIAFITGGYFVQANFRRQVVQVRKSWGLLLIYFIMATFIPFINGTHTFESWVLICIPLSPFAACAFLYPSKKWLPVLLHWVMVAFIIAISYIIK